MDYKKCECCGQETLEAGGRFDICPVCGWEDDNVQNHKPDFWGGANFICLNEAKRVYAEGKDLRAYKKAAQRRYREQQKKAEQETTQEPLSPALA